MSDKPNKKEIVNQLVAELGLKIAVENQPPKGSHPETWELLRIDKGVPIKTVDNVSLILENDPEYQTLCYDEHSSRILWKGERIEDHHILKIRRDIEVRYFLCRPTKEINDCVMMVAHQNLIEPIKDYLMALHWDGERRIDFLFEDWFRAKITPETTELVRAMSRKWVISCVARVLQAGSKMDTCLVLAGEKGRFKSTALKVLAGEDWFTDSAIDIKGKAGYELLHQTGAWIWELAEMASLYGKGADQAKQFLSSASDTYRPSYGRLPITRKRRTVFCATTNNFQFLSDGPERRFWIIQVMQQIDIQALHTHRDQIWAEAVSYYKNGEDWWLNDKHSSQLSAYQSTYIIEDSWTFDVVQCLEAPVLKTTTDIMKYLQVPIAQQHSGNSRRIAQICRDCGYEQITKNRKRYWSKK